MTNELEKQFFYTFGIEPKKQCYYWDCPYSTGNIVNDTAMNERDCNSCKNPNKEVYPQITDRILLELICINNNHAKYMEEFIVPRVLKTLKEQALDMLMSNVKDYTDIKHQVRTLFEEG